VALNMSGTISPGRLLGTLRILLSPKGGIKSRGEVGRLVSLMQKFSRKLVSKVIYIHILKSSTQPLLEAFFAESGWSLLISWLSTAITSANWPLCSELLQLLALCSPPPHLLYQAVLDLLQPLQGPKIGALSALIDQVTLNWSQQSETSTLTPTPAFVFNPSLPAFSPLQPEVSSVSSSVLSDNPMTPSRRCKKTVIVTNPTMVGHSSASAAEKVVMTVTYQEKPVQNIMDVFKYQRRRFAEEIETQAWKRDGEVRKRISERITVPNKGAKNCFKSARRTSPMPPSVGRFQSEVPTFEEELLNDDPIFEVEIVPRPRRRLTDSTSILVSVVADRDTILMKDLNIREEGVDADTEGSNPLKIFEEISNELKENLLLEKHIALNQDVIKVVSDGRGREGSVWGRNNNKQLSGMEGSAKDFRLARREKFREEQKLLEEHNEVYEREEREKKRERIKKVKREVDRRAKELKEKDERRRKIEIEEEERKKREKMEEEFKKRREEERLKRQERKRQEKNLGSFKKSEIKNGLNNEEKLKIKLIAQQMKHSSDILEATPSSSFQGRIPKLMTNETSDQGESASRPAKPLFSTAKNKNRDLLASLEDPNKPLKRPIVLAKDFLVQKKPIITKKITESVDYGVIHPVVDVVNKIPRNKEVYQNEEEAIGGESDDKLSQPEHVHAAVAVASLKSYKLKERVSASRTEAKVKQDEKEIKVKMSRGDVESRSKPGSSKDRNKNVNMANSKKSNETIENNVKNENKKGVESKDCLPSVKSSRKVSSSKGGEKDDKSKVIAKSGISLKPVSQLKESSLFGDLLENVEKSAAKKRKMSSIEEYKKRAKHSKTVEKKVDDVSNRMSVPEPVVTVPRKVCGILIVERGTETNKKSIKWREDENLVQVEYFAVDIAERVNVHKLKFEEVRRQECEKERSLLTTRNNAPATEKDFDDEPLTGLKLLTNCGRTNFKSGNKSQEKEYQRLREESVLPSVCLGDAPANPSEPDVTQNRNLFAVGTTRDILADDVSGEGTEVDYSSGGWPMPIGSVLRYDDGIGAGQFYGDSESFHDGDHVIEFDLGKAGQRLPSNPISKGFGRGAAASQPIRGFRGGFDARGRGGFGGKRTVPCMYWRRGNCRDGQTCKFLHL